MKRTARIPAENLGYFIILSELEGVGIETQHVCFVIATEVLVLDGVMWGMLTLLDGGASEQISSEDDVFFNVYNPS